MEWQPIETAPKDGTPIDIWLTTIFKDGRETTAERVADVKWEALHQAGYKKPEKYGWGVWNDEWAEYFGIEGAGASCDSTATHWMPLPAPPRS